MMSQEALQPGGICREEGAQVSVLWAFGAAR